MAQLHDTFLHSLQCQCALPFTDCRDVRPAREVVEQVHSLDPGKADVG